MHGVEECEEQYFTLSHIIIVFIELQQLPQEPHRSGHCSATSGWFESEHKSCVQSTSNPQLALKLPHSSATRHSCQPSLLTTVLYVHAHAYARSGSQQNVMCTRTPHTHSRPLFPDFDIPSCNLERYSNFTSYFPVFHAVFLLFLMFYRSCCRVRSSQ